MYNLIDNKGKVVLSSDDKNFLRKVMMVHYATEEIPRMAKIIAFEDLSPMVLNDADTAMTRCYIEDYMRIEEVV